MNLWRQVCRLEYVSRAGVWRAANWQTLAAINKEQSPRPKHPARGSYAIDAAVVAIVVRQMCCTSAMGPTPAGLDWYALLQGASAHDTHSVCTIREIGSLSAGSLALTDISHGITSTSEDCSFAKTSQSTGVTAMEFMWRSASGTHQKHMQVVECQACCACHLLSSTLLSRCRFYCSKRMKPVVACVLLLILVHLLVQPSITHCCLSC